MRMPTSLQINSAANKRGIRPPHIRPLFANVMQNDDLVYLILTIASASASTERLRREALFGYSLVCQVWGRAAQSLLFRHVFLQIRPPMLALLKVISHKTERGKRLASYIKSAEIRLSRTTEVHDPYSLPMIHPRHLPALLCHMPNLLELNLVLGFEAPSMQILETISRGPCIRTLTLREKKEAVRHPAIDILRQDVNPWPHIQSLYIRHSDCLLHDQYPPNECSPQITLSQLTVEYPTSTGFVEVPWLIRHSAATLTHLTLLSSHVSSSYGCLSKPELQNIRSLTLGRITWTDELFKQLHSFHQLKELRLVSLIFLTRGFPANLPDTIEHLVFTTLLAAAKGSSTAPVLDQTRPALLKSCKAVSLPHSLHYISSQREFWYPGDHWANQYISSCWEDGVDAELVTSLDAVPESMIKVGREGGLAQHPPCVSLNPSPSQLDLTDFNVIKRSEGEDEPIQESPPRTPRRLKEERLPVKSPGQPSIIQNVQLWWKKR